MADCAAARIVVRAGDVELGAWRSVEIAGVRIDLGGLAGLEDRLLRRERQSSPLRPHVLDEGGLPMAERPWVGIGLDAPGAGLRAGEQRIE